MLDEKQSSGPSEADDHLLLIRHSSRNLSTSFCARLHAASAVLRSPRRHDSQPIVWRWVARDKDLRRSPTRRLRRASLIIGLPCFGLKARMLRAADLTCDLVAFRLLWARRVDRTPLVTRLSGGEHV